MTWLWLNRIDRAGSMPGGDEAGSGLARLLAQLCRVLPDGDRVHVDKAVDRLDPLVLLFDKALQRAKVVAKRQPARGLDAREDARRKALRRLDRLGAMSQAPSGISCDLGLIAGAQGRQRRPCTRDRPPMEPAIRTPRR